MNKKIILGLVLVLLLTGLNVNAFSMDDNLNRVWERRIDLQNAFPDKGDELIAWAGTYGWKEDASLFEYNPNYIAPVVNLYDSKIKEQDAKIKKQDDIIAGLITRIENLEKKRTTIAPESKNLYLAGWLTVLGQASFGNGLVITNDSFIKMPIVNQVPSGKDCDELSEVGRMVIYDISNSGAKTKIYICQQTSDTEVRWQW